MSRSYLKFGVAVLLAGCAGLAYSQFPSAGSQAPKAERVLTVHENGKANRCRLIASWTTPEGSKAYQLQSLETGELMTMTEEGPTTQVQGSAKSKAVPMKIFHFGKSKAPPAGAPMPPAHVLRDPVYQSAMSGGQPMPTQTIVQTGYQVGQPSTVVQKVVPSTAGGQIVAMPTNTAPTYPMPTQTMPMQAVDSKVVSTRVLGDEKVVYWDERTGSPDRPQGAFNPTTQKGPWDQAPVVVNVQPQTPAITSYPTQMPKAPQTFAHAAPTQPSFTPPTISTGNNGNWSPTPTKMPNAPIHTNTAPTFANNTNAKTGIQQVSGTATTNTQIVTAQGTNVAPNGGIVQAGGIKTAGSGIQRVSGDAPPSLPPAITAPPAISTPPMISTPPAIAAPPTFITPPTTAPASIDFAKPAMSPTQILPPDAPNNTTVSNITAGSAHRAVDMASLGIDPRTVKSFSMYVPSSQASGGIGTVMTAPGLKAVQGGPTGVIIQADGDLPYTKIMSSASTGGFGGAIPCQSCMVGSASGVGSIQSGKGRTIILHEGVPVATAPTHRPLLSKIFPPKERTPAGLPKSKSPDSLPEITRADPLGNADLGSKTDFPKMPAVTDEGAKKIETTKLPETATPASASVPAAANTTNVKTPFSTASTSEQTEVRNTVKTTDLKKPGELAKVEPTKDDPKTGQKRTFREMWGKLTDNKSPLPGQSTLDQTASNKTFAAPPTSMTEKGKGDVMLSPENLKTPDRGLFKHTPVPPSYVATNPAPAPLTAPPTAPPSTNAGPSNYTQDRVPAGARSVLAARSGAGGPVQFVPVPVVTVPDPIRPPVPPEPKMPEPPQPTAYQNAFTPPQQPVNQIAPQMPPQMVPPGTLPQMPPAVMGPMLAPQQASMQQQMLNPYQNPYAMQQMAQMQQFLMHQQAMIQQQTMMQQMMMQQSMMAQQQQQGAYHQVGYQPAGYGPMMPPQMQQPMPPQMPQNVQPVQYQQPAHQQAAPASMPTLMPPTSAQPVTPGQGTPTVQQLISTLLESPYPAQREWAANSLSTQDWKTNPQILHVLSNCAKNDPAANVRAGCVYSMGRMNANSELVMNTLRHLENDVDPKVRSEVEQARLRLAPR